MNHPSQPRIIPLLLSLPSLLTLSLCGCDLISPRQGSPWSKPPSAHDAQTTYAEPAETNAYLADTFRRILSLHAADISDSLASAIDALYLPDPTRAWLIDRFGADLGSLLAADLVAQWPAWRAHLNDSLTQLRSQIPPTAQTDLTNKPRSRYASTPRNLAHCLSATPMTLGGVTRQRGTRDLTVSLEHFAFIDGEFRFVGDLSRLSLSAAALPLLPAVTLLPPSTPQPLTIHNDQWAVSPSPDGGLTLRRAQQDAIFNLLPPPAPPDALTLTAFVGPYVAAATASGFLILWNPETGAEVARLPPPAPASIISLQVYDKMEVILAASMTQLWIWDVNSGKSLIVIAVPSPVIAAALTPSPAPALYAVLRDGALWRWDLQCLLP
jgi:hypothetical protein